METVNKISRREPKKNTKGGEGISIPELKGLLARAKGLTPVTLYDLSPGINENQRNHPYPLFPTAR